jgi:hypothetical protein
MHIERLSSKYYDRTCDMRVLFQMNKYAETCRLTLCVKDAVIEVILNETCPFYVVYPTRWVIPHQKLYSFYLVYVIPIRYGLDGPGFEL